MTAEEITEPGFYWNRWDEYRPWTMTFVTREAKNPEHPRYGIFRIDGSIKSIVFGGPAWPSMEGEFIGPIEPPPR